MNSDEDVARDSLIIQKKKRTKERTIQRCCGEHFPFPSEQSSIFNLLRFGGGGFRLSTAWRERSEMTVMTLHEIMMHCIPLLL